MASFIISKTLFYFLIYFIYVYSVQQTKSINASVGQDLVNYNFYSGNGSYSYAPNDSWHSDRVRKETVSGSDQVVFQTSDPDLLANNLVHVETNPDGLVVTMYNLDGTIKQFNIKVPGGEQEEYEPYESAPEDSETEVTPEEVEIPADDATPKGVKLEKDNKYLKYTFADGVKCLSAHYDGKEVWSHKPNEAFPVAMVFSIKGNRMLAKFEDSLKIVRLTDDGWESFYSGNPKAEEVDISKRSSNGFFIYGRSGKLHSFTAKDNHMFRSVFIGGGLMGSAESIWSTYNFADYANMVVYDNTDPNNLAVTIYHINGLIRTLKKQSGANWNETEIKCSETELKPEHVLILIEENESRECDDLSEPTTLGSSVSESRPAEDADAKAPTNSGITVDTDTEETFSRISSEDGTVSVGEIQGGATAREREPSSALRDTNAPYVEEPDCQEMRDGSKPAGDMVSPEEGRTRIRSTLAGTMPALRIPVHLDIRTKTTSVQFDYSESVGLLTYVAKEDYYFRSVKNGGTEIWTGASIDGSALKVIAELDSSSYLIGLTLHLVSGEVKRFKYSNRKLDEVACIDPMGLPPGSVDSTTDNLSQPPTDS